ncbi:MULTISPECIES: DUF6894 family protein [Bradyrhizobium]|uniref:DUF6894 family protein n=1 Tax=Bradyrhizobium TaxID=374 RepID=UPI0003F7F67B|nr:hypothetical protein [Bradyrhizobium sp. SEMIA]
MKRYYFDLKDGSDLSHDEEGMELPDVLSAQQEAAKALSEIARDAIRSPDRTGHQMAVEVRDANGPVVQVKYVFEIGEAAKDNKESEYRQHAAEAQKMADRARNDDDMASWLRVAQGWLGLLTKRPQTDQEAFDQAVSEQGTAQEQNKTSN